LQKVNPISENLAIVGLCCTFCPNDLTAGLSHSDGSICPWFRKILSSCRTWIL